MFEPLFEVGVVLHFGHVGAGADVEERFISVNRLGEILPFGHIFSDGNRPNSLGEIVI
jgi:hypothetical protein